MTGCKHYKFVKYVATTCLLTVVSACGDTAVKSVLPQGGTTEVLDAPPGGVELGWGWDSLNSNSVPNLCIEFIEAEEFGQTQSVSMSEVSDKFDAMSKMGMSASASVKSFGVSGSAKGSFAQSMETTGFSSSFILKATVDNGVRFVSPSPSSDRGHREALRAINDVSETRAPFPEGGVRLTPQAKKWAKTNMRRFRLECGDSYISAMYNGAQFYAAITSSSSSKKAKQDVAAAVSGSGWGVSVDVKASKSKTSSQESASYSVQVFQSGGRGGDLKTDLEGVKEMLTKLPAAAANSPKFHRIAITPYSQLPGWHYGSMNIEDTEFTQLGERWGAFTKLYDEIEFIKNNPGNFDLSRSTGLAQLKVLQDMALVRIRRLEKAAYECGEELVDCQLDERDFVDPYWYRLHLPLPSNNPVTPRATTTAAAPAKPVNTGENHAENVLSYHVLDQSSRICKTNKNGYGCLFNHEADGLLPYVPTSNKMMVALEDSKLKADGIETSQCLASDGNRLLLADCDVPTSSHSSEKTSIRYNDQCLAGAERNPVRPHLTACKTSNDQLWPIGYDRQAARSISVSVDRRLMVMGKCLTYNEDRDLRFDTCEKTNDTRWAVLTSGEISSNNLCLAMNEGDEQPSLVPCGSDPAGSMVTTWTFDKLRPIQ